MRNVSKVLRLMAESIVKQHPAGLRLFLDLDGVLADFDVAAHRVLGAPPDAVAPNVMWPRIASQPDFFGTLPLMPDALELWSFAAPYSPTILTGAPRCVAPASRASTRPRSCGRRASLAARDAACVTAAAVDCKANGAA